MLLVEDDPNTLVALEATFSEWGIKTFSAINGIEATEQLIQHPEISVLFSDIQLPDGMTGFQLARTVKTVMPHIDVILGTAYSADNLRRMHGYDDTYQVLYKPYDINFLKLLIMNEGTVTNKAASTNKDIAKK